MTFDDAVAYLMNELGLTHEEAVQQAEDYDTHNYCLACGESVFGCSCDYPRTG